MLEGPGTNFFSQIYSSDGKYMAQNHLAQMIALLGSPPNKLVARELEMRKWNFAPPVEYDEGKLCHKAYQFYNGPFFDNEGTIHTYQFSPGLFTLMRASRHIFVS
jgi:hypothetical protein